jgi:hypothetical protein
MENLNKLKVINVKDVDKSKVFIAIDSASWRTPNKVSINSLLESIKIDPSSLKLETTYVPEIIPNVFSEPYNNQGIYFTSLPQNASELLGMHLAADENYLYVWIGNRWKRTLLSTW